MITVCYTNFHLCNVGLLKQLVQQVVGVRGVLLGAALHHPLCKARASLGRRAVGGGLCGTLRGGTGILLAQILQFSVQGGQEAPQRVNGVAKALARVQLGLQAVRNAFDLSG